jgi:predicted RNase H-like HicB family nuclease
MAEAHVTYHYESDGWWAESPEHPEYSAFGASLFEVRLLAHEGLRFLTEDESLTVVDPFSITAALATTTTAEGRGDPGDEMMSNCFGMVPQLMLANVGASVPAPVKI